MLTAAGDWNRVLREVEDGGAIAVPTGAAAGAGAGPSENGSQTPGQPPAAGGESPSAAPRPNLNRPQMRRPEEAAREPVRVATDGGKPPAVPEPPGTQAKTGEEKGDGSEVAAEGEEPKAPEPPKPGGVEIDFGGGFGKQTYSPEQAAPIRHLQNLSGAQARELGTSRAKIEQLEQTVHDWNVWHEEQQRSAGNGGGGAGQGAGGGEEAEAAILEELDRARIVGDEAAYNRAVLKAIRAARGGGREGAASTDELATVVTGVLQEILAPIDQELQTLRSERQRQAAERAKAEQPAKLRESIRTRLTQLGHDAKAMDDGAIMEFAKTVGPELKRSMTEHFARTGRQANAAEIATYWTAALNRAWLADQQRRQRSEAAAQAAAQQPRQPTGQFARRGYPAPTRTGPSAPTIVPPGGPRGAQAPTRPNLNKPVIVRQ